MKGGIISSNSDYKSYGIYNNSDGIVIIGIKGDGIVSQEEPLIQGIRTSMSTSYDGYGIYNVIGKLYFYDSTLR